MTLLIAIARKPITGRTITENVLKWRGGGINVDASRVATTQGDRQQMLEMSRGFVGRRFGKPESMNYGYEGSMPVKTLSEPSPLGRWPANIVLEKDVSVIDGFPVTSSGNLLTTHFLKASENTSMSGPNQGRNPRQNWGGNIGSAARLFQQFPFEDVE